MLGECGIGSSLIEECGAESAGAERENGVHVVPETPFAEGIVGVSATAAEAIAEGIQEGIEIIITDDKHPLGWEFLVMVLESFDELQADGGFARTFFPEDNGGAGVAAVTEDFVPGRVMNGLGAVLLEDVVGLGVFLAEGVESYAVVFEELLELHGVPASFKEPAQRSAWLRKSPGLPVFPIIAVWAEGMRGGPFAKLVFSKAAAGCG